jgi:hypothetical protein
MTPARFVRIDVPTCHAEGGAADIFPSAELEIAWLRSYLRQSFLPRVKRRRAPDRTMRI